jgi:hypothetical protein
MMNFMVVDVLLTVIVLLSYQSPLAETALRRRIRRDSSVVSLVLPSQRSACRSPQGCTRMAESRRLALASCGSRRPAAENQAAVPCKIWEQPPSPSHHVMAYGLMASCNHIYGLLRKVGLDVWHNKLSINYLH